MIARSIDPDGYIYEPMRRGVIDEKGDVIPESELPDFVHKGMRDPKARIFDRRYNLGEANLRDTQRRKLTLPTETWREYVSRRERCLELREKLARGEINDINDLITYNLDIRQFAQDAIGNCEGPELLRAFYRAITTVAVLDPTCGSGAFLFAALNILEPLYEACLDRMQAFVDDLDRSGERHRPEKFSDFRKVLAEIEKHPSHRYFILKSIIVNNLYGVDIMEEAVEICKLRLFLKLVAQVDSVKDLEPLPDIDFNIRPGNTLVGFVSVREIRDAAENELERDHDGMRQGRMMRGETADAIHGIEEDAEIVDRAFRRFHEMQTTYGMDAKEFASAKRELRERLKTLAGELDQYLAGEYGIDLEKKDTFEAWRASHQPFHWFAEFYGIMQRGGFDVIIGNPPYFDLKHGMDYSVKNYSTLPTKNLYPLVIERCIPVAVNRGRLGFIVPVSSISTGGYTKLQELVLNLPAHFSSYDRPSRLFDGLEHIQLTIHLLENRGASEPDHFVTECYRWSTVERVHLFPTLQYGRGVQNCRIPAQSSASGQRRKGTVFSKPWLSTGVMAGTGRRLPETSPDGRSLQKHGISAWPEVYSRRLPRDTEREDGDGAADSDCGSWI